MKQPIHTVAAPQAIGTYSQAIRCGETVYLSGQIGLDPASGTLVAGGTVASWSSGVVAERRVEPGEVAPVSSAPDDAADVTGADVAKARENVRPSLDPVQVEALRAFSAAR